MKFFTRHSEYEKVPVLIDDADGVWLDEFNGHWISAEVIKKYIDCNKRICIVSPELHGRSYNREWEEYKVMEQKLSYKEMFLCTDFPEEARNFFNG
jgi:hypothetical protein